MANDTHTADQEPQGSDPDTTAGWWDTFGGGESTEQSK